MLMLLSFGLCQAQIIKFTDWEEAKGEAIKSDKNILIVLTGSEWCAPCVRMKKNVFANQEFINYVHEHLVILEINLPNPLNLDSKVAKDYKYFKEKYNTSALPTLILVNREGTEKLKIDKGATKLATVLEKLKEKNQ
jgi:thioredoxin-related protein